MKLYTVIYFVSHIVRTFCLHNPFESYGDIAIGQNLIFGGLLIPFTYHIVFVLVGNIVESPSIKSGAFLVFYIMHNYILKFILDFTHNINMIVLLVALYYIIVLIIKIKCKLY